jgi:alpha-tubulin suppressor-like RCC1 family protein
LRCWGLGDAIGDGANANRYTPVMSGIPTDWRDVTAGGDHTCGISADKSLWCWGDNSNGQVGNGTTIDQPLPVRVGGSLNDWTDISAGSFHTCGIEQDAFLRCWGWNFSGQVGDGTHTDRLVPIEPPGGQFGQWTSVSLGHVHSCAINAGSVWCWGHNADGRVGDGSTTERSVPTIVATGGGWTAISLGSFHTCALRAGQLWCWGYNFDGELGDGTNIDRLKPEPIGTVTDWTALGAAGNHTCAIRPVGLYCWGQNMFGEVGDATTINRNVPKQISTATDWSFVGGGNAHSCGIRSGQLFCWGLNSSGQLGDGTTTDAHTPVRIGNATDWVSVDGGATHTVGARNVP